MRIISINFRSNLALTAININSGIGRKSLPINGLRLNPLYPSSYSLKVHQFRQIGNLKTGNKGMSEREKEFVKYLEEIAYARAANKRTGPILSFEDYVKTNLQSFEDYSKDPQIVRLTKNDKARMKQAYDAYCHVSYNMYKDSFRSDNPATMI